MHCTSNGQIPGQICKSNRSGSVTECKMPKKKKKKMRRGVAFDLLTLTAWWGEGTPLRQKENNKLFDSFLNQSDPKSSTVLSNVSLSVGAPERVYLHSLVRRLLYSHLTPSTLSSPSLPPVLSPPVHSHPDTLSPPTTLLHGWLCLVLRSMHVCCLPWQTPQIESLFSLPPRAAEARRRPDAPPSENDHTCRGSHSWGWQGTQVHKHSHLQFGSVRFISYTEEKRCLFGISCCTNIIHTHIVRDYFVIKGVWLDFHVGILRLNPHEIVGR